MILLIEKDLAHHRVPVFSRLNDRLGGELVVMHGDSPPSLSITDPEERKFPFEDVYIRNFWIHGSTLYFNNLITILGYVRRARLVIVRHSIRNLVFFPLLYALRLSNKPVIIWGQGFSMKRGFRPDRRVSDWLHLHAVKSADAYVCYTEEIRKVLSKYVAESKLFVATNTLDVDALTRMHIELSKEGKEHVKSRLGLGCKFYLVFSGRLHQRKRLRVLLEAQELIQRQGVDTGVLVIGDGPERETLEEYVELKNVPDVSFFGRLMPTQSAELLYAADVMVIPGWIGLAAVHGFAMGLPVVGQRVAEDLTGHPPEAAYVEECAAGVIAEAGGAEELAVAILEALRQRERLGTVAEAYARDHLSLEKMVDGFVAAISRVQSSCAVS